MNISRIFSIFTAFILLGVLSLPVWSASPQLVQQQKNQRQFILLWKDQRVFGNGYHRPYSTLKANDENNDVVWEGKTNARGTFNFLLEQGVVNPAYKHTLIINAYDQFGQEILKADGTPDIVRAVLLPGLQTQGKTHPNAKILLIDTDGKALNTYTADAQGNYVIFNAPEGSTLRISKSGITEEVPFQPGTIEPVYIEGVSDEDTTDTSELSDNSRSSGRDQFRGQNDLQPAEKISEEDSFLTIFLIIAGIAVAAVIGMVVIKKRRENN